MVKTCQKCGLDKDSTEYHKLHCSKDGYSYICKVCKKEKDTARYFSNSRKKKANAAYKKARLDEIREYKAKIGCKYCPENNGWCLDFHHKKKNKEFGIASKPHLPWNKLLKEMAKCEVLCANCHRKFHAGLQLKKPNAFGSTLVRL